jgi:hypothetical protein
LRINVAVPESHVSAHILNAALEPVVRLNEAMIRSGEAPSFDRALKNGHVKWKPEPPGQEHFDHALEVLGRRWGDCDDLAPWHAGSLRASGQDPGARAIVRRSGPSTWHAVVLRSDGKIEDPSARAGMPTRGQSVSRAAVLPVMSARPPRSQVVGRGVGAFYLRPEIALRKEFDQDQGPQGYAARVDIPWMKMNAQGEPSEVEMNMATLHVAPLAATALNGAIEGAIELANLGGYAHPDHLARLGCIAGRLRGHSSQALGRVYGEGHVRAAEAYCQQMLEGLTEIERFAREKKKPSVRSVVAAAPANQLASGGRLVPGQALTSSPKGTGRLTFQSDGNVCLDWGSRRLWCSHTEGKGVRLDMQKDGNAVIYDRAGKAVWATGTQGRGGAVLRIQDDGNLVVYQGTNPLWSTDTQNGRRTDFTGRGVLHSTGGGGFDLGDLAHVALAIGTAGASEIVHEVAPDVGRFIGNAVKVAGREIGKAADSLVSLEHEISAEIAKIPLVGGPLAMIFDAAFHAAIGPMTVCFDVILKGKRLDEAFLSHLQTSLQDFKNVGPYVQMVASLVPGVGTAVSVAIGVGLSLANGQPIDQVILSGISSAMPGGPIAKAALNMAYAGIHAAVAGENLDVAKLGTMALSAAAGAIGLPPAATQALTAGVGMCGQLCSGAKLDTALSQAVIEALPVPANAKQALREADALALDLAHGKRLDKALLARAGDVATYIPNIDPQLRAQIANAARTGASIASGATPEQALGAALRNGAADALISLGGRALPREVTDTVAKGLAVGNAVMHQARKVEQLVAGPFQDKLANMGQAFAGVHAIVSEARKICSPPELRGFDVGQGMLSQSAKLFEVTTVRNALQGPARKGFDMAIAHRVGIVAHPVPTHLPPAHQAGHAITLGLAANAASNQAAILSSLRASAGGAAAGMARALERKACAAKTADAFRQTCMHPGA